MAFPAVPESASSNTLALQLAEHGIVIEVLGPLDQWEDISLHADGYPLARQADARYQLRIGEQQGRV